MALRALTRRPIAIATITPLAPATFSAYGQRLNVRFSSTSPASVADIGFWKSLVPKALRPENRAQLKKKSKEWNPATFFIVMFLFIGSMSIQMIALRNQFERYVRQADIRIGTLREVVEKIQRGEEVDVERALGTGDPKKEEGWDEMLRAIEKDDATRKPKKQEKASRPTPESQPAEAAPSQPAPSSSGRTASMKGFF